MSALSRRKIRSLLAWFAVVAAAIALAVTWGSDDVLAQESAPSGDVDLGGQLYAQACAQCHASDGSGAVVPGSDRRAPALTDRPQVTAAYVDLVMRTGRMPPAADPFNNQPREVVYGDAQRLAIVAYVVDEFGVTNNLDDVTELPKGNAGAGQNVYATNCAACHGSTGAGGVAGGGAWTPTVNVYDSATIAEAIRVGPFQMPAFASDQITDQQVADVSAFLEEVRAEDGTPLGLVELNPVFASGFVALLAVAMILSLFWISSKPTWFPDPEQAPDEPQKVDPTDAPSLQSVDTEHNP